MSQPTASPAESGPIGGGAWSLRSLFANASWLYGSRVLAAVVQFGQAILVTRAFGPAHYGIWSTAIGFAMMVQAFATFSLTDPLTRHLVIARGSETRDELRLLLSSAFWVQVVTSWLAFGVILGLSPWYTHTAKGAGGPEFLYLYWLCAIGVPGASLYPIWYCVMREQGRYRFLAVVDFAGRGGLFALVVALKYTGQLTVGTLAIANAAMILCVAAVQIGSLAAVMRGVYRLVPLPLSPRRVIARAGELGEFWQFMGATWIGNSLGGVLLSGDVVILGRFVGEAQVGFYRLARQMSNLVDEATTALTAVIYQDFNELTSSRRVSALRSGLARLLRAWSPAVVVGWPLLAVAGHYGIPLVFGAEYQPATGLFALLLIGSAAKALMFWVHPLLLALGRFKYILLMQVGWVPLALVAMAAAAAAWGNVGPAAVLSVVLIGMLSQMAFKVRSLLASER